MELQISAQNQESAVAVKEFGAKNAGKAKQNKLGVFAKMLDGLRVKIPQNGEAVNNKAKVPAAGQKVSLKDAKNNAPLNLMRDEKVPAEKKKKSEKEGAEAGAVFVSKTAKKASVQDNGASVKAEKEISVLTETAQAGRGEVLSSLKDAKENKEGDEKIVSSKNSAKIDGKQKKNSDNAVQNAEEKTSTLNQMANGANQAKNLQNTEKNGDLRVSKSNKRRESSLIEVRDARISETNAEVSGQIQQVSAVQQESDGKTADLILDLTKGRANDAPDKPDQTAGNRNFGEMLADALSDNLSSDIVRQASIVLRDGGQGTIRLFLKPETLGSVKIRLELAENKITGHIVVDSEEALRAFEKEVHSLEQAFKDSGFESASLNTGFASGDGNARQWDGSEMRQFFSERFVSERYDDKNSASGFDGTYTAGLDGSVNMLA